LTYQNFLEFTHLHSKFELCIAVNSECNCQLRAVFVHYMSANYAGEDIDKWHALKIIKIIT